ncbi:MAG: tRNA threonylcarbamoyladenosine dehydratase [Akkermansiaceae bacterium]|nr:tRNA threonylcarbamoyladenosine dehydratase [Akkermansiaceae bacterium]
MDRFGGIQRLYGKAAMKKFQSAHVCVVGIGGVGSWCVESLARSGIGRITMIDLDEICISNINRQLHAMDGEIGRQKTAAMASRVEAINPECEVVCLETFFSSRNAEEILSNKFDYLIDAIDHANAKSLLLASCCEHDIPVISCGAAGGLRDPSQIQINDISRCYNDTLINKVRKIMRSDYGFPAGADPKKKIKGRKFGISCVFSSESPVFEHCNGEVSEAKPVSDSNEPNRLNCVSGFGSITHITATFGLFAVSRCLAELSS